MLQHNTQEGASAEIYAETLTILYAVKSRLYRVLSPVNDES